MYKEFWKSDTMEDGDDPEMTRWKCLMTILNTDVLPEILQYVDIFESPSSMAQFADAWHRASFVQPLWHTLDFSVLRSHYIKNTTAPFVCVASQSERTLTNLLSIALSLSPGNIMTLIFHYNLFLSNDQFAYTAQR